MKSYLWDSLQNLLVFSFNPDTPPIRQHSPLLQKPQAKLFKSVSHLLKVIQPSHVAGVFLDS